MKKAKAGASQLWQSVSKRGVALVTSLAFTTAATQITSFSFATAAHAQAVVAPKKVALFVFPKNRQSAGDAQVLQAFMRIELARLVNTVPVTSGAEARTNIRAEVRPKLEAGFLALNERSGDKAEPFFEQAYTALERYKGPLEKRLMARAIKGLGSSQIMNGSVASGQELLNVGLNLWPNQQLGEYGWTLDLRTAFSEMFTRRSGQEAGAVEVDTEPAGAMVLVGGQLRGFSPVTVSDLPAGRHWVETAIDGYVWTGMFVDVPAGNSAIHSLELQAAPSKSAFDGAYKTLERSMARGAVDAPMGELSRIINADSVIALEVTTSNAGYALSGYLKDGNGDVQKISRTIARDGDVASNLRTFLATVLKSELATAEDDTPLDGPPQLSVISTGDGSDLVLDPRDPIFSTGGASNDDSITDKWWFWTLVGGVTAGLAVGAYVLFGADNASSGPTGTISVDINGLR